MQRRRSPQNPPGHSDTHTLSHRSGRVKRLDGAVGIVCVCDRANLVLFLNLREKREHVMQRCGPGPSQPLSLHSGSQGPGRTKSGRLVTPFWRRYQYFN